MGALTSRTCILTVAEGSPPAAGLLCIAARLCPPKRCSGAWLKVDTNLRSTNTTLHVEPASRLTVARLFFLSFRPHNARVASQAPEIFQRLITAPLFWCRLLTCCVSGGLFSAWGHTAVPPSLMRFDGPERCPRTSSKRSTCPMMSWNRSARPSQTSRTMPKGEGPWEALTAQAVLLKR